MKKGNKMVEATEQEYDFWIGMFSYINEGIDSEVKVKDFPIMASEVARLWKEDNDGVDVGLSFKVETGL